MNNRFLIMFVILALVMSMLVGVGAPTVYAQGDETLGDIVYEDEIDVELSPLDTILTGLYLVFLTIVTGIIAAFSLVVAFISGIVTFFIGVGQYIAGLF